VNGIRSGFLRCWRRRIGRHHICSAVFKVRFVASFNSCCTNHYHYYLQVLKKRIAMKKAVAVTHVPFEDLGSLDNELRHAGYEICLFDACTGDLGAVSRSKPELLIFLGGPIGVYERDAYPFLNREIELIRSRLDGKRPTIGICLGAQLIAAAAGASVGPGRAGKEIGWGTINAGPDASLLPELAPVLGQEVRVLHWHGDTFDLPAGSHHLAATAAYANQAFAIENHTLALQFHIEVTPQGLERWYVGHACELGSAGIDVQRLRQESKTFAPALESAAQVLWRGWLSRL
jgi:GMP synthase (glutamine-hydrolysing)